VNTRGSALETPLLCAPLRDLTNCASHLYVSCRHPIAASWLHHHLDAAVLLVAERLVEIAQTHCAAGRKLQVLLPERKIFTARGTAGRENRSFRSERRLQMNSVIYLIGLVVVVLAVLSFLGIH
jgi:hypothetical protein